MTLTRTERICLSFLLAIFTWFTWRGMTMHYSGDDMMNMYAAWGINPWRLAKAQVMFWIPIYRPLGAAIYRTLYETLGFNPVPLNVLSWLLLAVNVLLGYRFFRTLTESAVQAIVATAVTLAHPAFQDLYLSSGTIYDHLWYTFTVLGLTCYAKWRRSERGLTWPRQLLLLLLCVLSMASKESGVALPVLMGLFELIFHFPGRDRLAPWLRTYSPLFAVLAAVSLVFIKRVNETPEIAMTGAYHAKASLGLWLQRLGDYFGILAASHFSISPGIAAAILIALLLLAVLFRNRTMLFGLAFFLATITPVALISLRPGYVLYVPELGLGLYFAALFGLVAGSLHPRYQFAAAALVVVAATWFYQRNWPSVFDPRIAPEKRLSEQFQHDYPKMRQGARLLFVTDDFPQTGWDLVFNLRLLYNDRTLVVHRLQAPRDQQPPDLNNLKDYDHVFTLGAGRYVELDPADVKESLRLNILADYAVGRFMDIARRDHAAYVVSGLMDGDSPEPSRWTAPKLSLKYELAPVPCDFYMKFWAPDFVTKSGKRTLSLVINGKELSAIPLEHDGMNEFRMPVPPSAITPAGYTMVDLIVQNPWKDTNNIEYGVIILKAGFEYRATIK